MIDQRMRDLLREKNRRDRYDMVWLSGAAFVCLGVSCSGWGIEHGPPAVGVLLIAVGILALVVVGILGHGIHARNRILKEDG